MTKQSDRSKLVAAVNRDVVARMDGRTRSGKLQCLPPNRACGSRCIPPNWKCREKGEGNDRHQQAVGKGSDLLAAAASFERGAKSLWKGTTTGSFELSQRGRGAIVRGFVKASPGDLSQKQELRARLMEASVPVGNVAFVAVSSVAVHLLAMRNPRYAAGMGGRINDSIRRGFSALQDRAPIIGGARAATRTAGARVGLRIAKRPSAAEALTNPLAQARAVRQGRQGIAPELVDYKSKILAVKPRETPSGAPRSFDDWHNASFKNYLSQRKDGRSVFTPRAARDFLTSQYKLDIPELTIKSLPLEASRFKAALQSRVQQEHNALTKLAADQGFNLKKPEDVPKFADFYVKEIGTKPGQLGRVKAELISLVDPKFTANKYATDLQTNTEDRFNKFFDQLADSPERLYKPDGTLRSLPLGDVHPLNAAHEGHAEILASAMFKTTNRVIAGPATAKAVNERFYTLNSVAKKTDRPAWEVNAPTAISVAREVSGKPKLKTVEEAITALRGTPFEAMRVPPSAVKIGRAGPPNPPAPPNSPPPPAKPPTPPKTTPEGGRNAKRNQFKFKSPAEQESYTTKLAELSAATLASGRKRYSTPAKAEAAARAWIARQRG